MSDSSGEKTEASDVELKSIVVNTNETPKRGSCWEYNVSEQFPLASVPSTSGQAEIRVGAPHEGYSIMTTLKNSKMNGESSIRSESNVLVARLNFVDGIASGPCTLFDEDGLLFFTGHFVDGYREGRGKEYDESNNVIFDGFYEKGKKLPIFPVKKMGHNYWKELDANGNIVKICQKDDFNNNKGFCYYYDNGNLDRLCKWENKSEKEYNGKFKLYDEPHKRWLEGNFVNGYREGRGKEYDESNNVIFDGFYEKGKKLPIFPVKEMGEDYWKELDAEGNIVKICQKNDFNNYNGWCFEYSNKEMISKISEWENGEEIAVWKEFNDDIMTEYHDGKKVYKGEYLDSLESRYPRDGEGEEFDIDGKTRSFKGMYKNGKRHGMGICYKNGQPTSRKLFILGISSKKIFDYSSG